MRKNILFIVLATIVLCTSTGCKYETNDVTPETVFVTFKDYDDSVLMHTKIPYGTIAVYSGKKPSRETTVDKVYTFNGWDKNINQPLYANTIFNAKYIEEARKYVVTFKNYDGTLLQEVNVDYGSTAKYSASTPMKDSDDEHIEYKFLSWDKDINSYKIIADTTFIAQYSTIEYAFATFNNYDGTQLFRSKVVKGGTANYSGPTPTRAYSGTDKAYKFSGWDKTLSNLNADTTFTAQFDLLNFYTVTFKNYDGSTLQAVKVLHGEDATYTGSTPYRPSTTSGDYKYTYTFSGWSQSTKNVTSDLSVIAQYSTSTKVTGATAIRNHLDEYGTGSYNNVETSYSSGGTSTLGYSGSYFYMGYTNTSSLESYMAVSCTYGASSGTGTFQIYDGSTLMFAATYYVYFSNHQYSSIECKSISTNRYTTSDQLSAVAALTILAAKFAVNDANEYLSDRGLPYVF